MSNRTRQDAYERVSQARLGSLVEPSEEYLSELRSQLYLWIDEANKALNVVGAVSDDAETEAADACAYCDGPLMILGKLGHTEHYRCRHCGMDVLQ